MVTYGIYLRSLLAYADVSAVTALPDAVTFAWEDELALYVGELYRQTLGLAKRVHLTLVDDTPAEADAFFPELNPEEWAEVLREEHPADEKHVQAYTFIDYTRK